MFVKNLESCEEFMAGDGCRLRELLHPDKADLALRYSLAHAVVEPGLTTAWHKLTASEVYYILEGHGLMHVDRETEDVGPGQVVYIPPNAKQRIKNTGDGDLKFICLVDPAWRKEDEWVLEQAINRSPPGERFLPSHH